MIRSDIQELFLYLDDKKRNLPRFFMNFCLNPWAGVDITKPLTSSKFMHVRIKSGTEVSWEQLHQNIEIK